MRYLSIYQTAERATPPSEEEMTRMGKLIEEGMRAGWLIATEGCLPSVLGARVRKQGGKVIVTDGPFTESKEVVGGFAILQANWKRKRPFNWQRTSSTSPETAFASFASFTRYLRKRAAGGGQSVSPQES